MGGAPFRYWANINKRLPPNTSPISSTHMHTDEYATPTPTAAQPQSFGNDFNLIRAVEEYGPQRVAAIQKEIASITARQQQLSNELSVLERLISVTKLSDVGTQDIAWASWEGYTATANGSGIDMD